MKTRILSILGLILLLAACSGGADGGADPAGDSTPDQAVSDVTEPDAAGPGVGPHAYLPPPVTLQVFTVVVEASATAAAVDQEVLLTVRTARGAAAGELTYAWTVDGAPADGDAAFVDIARAPLVAEHDVMRLERPAPVPGSPPTSVARGNDLQRGHPAAPSSAACRIRGCGRFDHPGGCRAALAGACPPAPSVR